MSPSVSKPRFFTARINENGRIVIPAAVRQQLGLSPGEPVVMEIEDGVLRIESHRANIRRIQQEFSQPAAPDRPMPPIHLQSSQLIEDREEEAAHEMEEWLG